jgi:hypothetical protein
VTCGAQCGADSGEWLCVSGAHHLSSSGTAGKPTTTTAKPRCKHSREKAPILAAEYSITCHITCVSKNSRACKVSRKIAGKASAVCCLSVCLLFGRETDRHDG